MEIYLEGLNPDSIERQILAQFRKHGFVRSVAIVRDNLELWRRGSPYAFVIMDNDVDALRAIKHECSPNYDHSLLFVRQAQPEDHK